MRTYGLLAFGLLASSTLLSPPLVLADPTLFSESIIIDPADGGGSITLRGPSYDSTGPSPGVTFGYVDQADGVGAGVFQIHRYQGLYQWQFSDSDGFPRPAMTLGDTHMLTVTAPTATAIDLNPEILAITFRMPNEGPSASLSFNPASGRLLLNGALLATMNDVATHGAASYVPLNAAALAVGASATAVPAGSVALGTGIVTDEASQVIVGTYNHANEWPDNLYGGITFAVGNGTSETERSTTFKVHRDGHVRIAGSLAIGYATYSPGAGSLAAGAGSQAIGLHSFAAGDSAYTYAPRSVSLGGWNYITGEMAMGVGLWSRADGYCAMSLGYVCNAKYGFSFAAGEASVADGQAAFAAGSSRAIGHYSTTFGVGTRARSYGQMAVGRFNDVPDVALPFGVPEGSEPLFIIGNGSSENQRSNAMVVKNNGDVSVGGVLRVKPAGDLSMGVFTDGTQP